MKKILSLGLLFACVSLHAQTPVTIVKYFKQNTIDPRPPHMHGFRYVVVLSSGDTLGSGNVLKLDVGNSYQKVCEIYEA